MLGLKEQGQDIGGQPKWVLDAVGWFEQHPEDRAKAESECERWGIKSGSHKTPPLSDTTFRDPEQGMETNGYANLPEKVRGAEELPALETLAPDMFKRADDEPEITFDILDSHRGELHGEVGAWVRTPEGERKAIGYVEFSEYDDEIWVKYVFVREEWRRKGVATRMYQRIQREFPDEPITSSGTTDLGGKLRQSLPSKGVRTGAYAEAQNQVQHTDHQAVGMTKTPKSDPFAAELEALGQEAEPNPAPLSGRTESQPQAEGEDQLQTSRTGAFEGTTYRRLLGVANRWARFVTGDDTAMHASLIDDERRARRRGAPEDAPEKAMRALVSYELRRLREFHDEIAPWTDNLVLGARHS